MSTEPYDLDQAVAEFVDALAPLASIAESLGFLETTFSIQTDLMIIEKWYSEEDRKKILELIDTAWGAERDAVETVELVQKRERVADQRTFEQYAQDHGEDSAKKAFTPIMKAFGLHQTATKEISDLNKAHPVIYRVHAYANGK